MKKFIYIVLLLAACKPPVNHDGIYVSHTQGQFSIAYDTLRISDTIVINRTGYQKIRNGRKLSKAYKTRRWTINSPDAPVMQFSGDQLVLGQTTYTRLP